MISLLISQFAHGIWKPKFAQCAHVGNDVAPEKQDASIKCGLVKKHKINMQPSARIFVFFGL